MVNKIPHKHAELIKAWADGALIQSRCLSSPFVIERVWQDNTVPGWVPYYEYRIKPEPKPDVVKFVHIERTSTGTPRVSISCDHNWSEAGKPTYTQPSNLKLVFDGETGELKSATILSRE